MTGRAHSICLTLPSPIQYSHLMQQTKRYLGVWAAEGFEKWVQNFDLSE